MINFATIENNIDNGAVLNGIEVIIAGYFDYCKYFKTKYVIVEKSTYT